MSELSEFLDVRIGDIEVPQVLPTGVFKFVITHYAVDRAQNNNRTPYVRVTLKPIDVVTCEEPVNIGSARTLTHDFWRTPAADKIAREFFERKLGFDVTDEDTLGGLWERALGEEVCAEVEQNFSKKGNPYAEVKRFIKAE